MRKKLELLGLRGDATFEQLVVWCEEKYVRKLDTDQGTRGKKLTFLESLVFLRKFLLILSFSFLFEK